MKVVTYELEKMKKVGELLNEITVSGVRQARILAEIGNVVDSGQIGEIMEKGDSENGMEHKEI